MRRHRRFLFVPLALLVAALAPPAVGAAPAGSARYIVVFKQTVDRPGAATSAQSQSYGTEVSHVYRSALNGYAARISDATIDDVRSDRRVAYVARDRAVHVAAQTLPTGIDRIDGELSSTVSGNGSGSVDVDVAVIDTGIELEHPDLNVVGGMNCANGRTFDDSNGHGSHVAGTIGARDDSEGVVGVAPGARLWAVRVLNPAGSGSFASVICGVDFVTAHAGEIEVANMSLGGTGTEPSGRGCATGDPFHDAVCRSVQAGVTYAVAAGNESEDAAKHVPAAYDEVITVSALADFDGQPGGTGSPTCREDEDDTFANFSNFGPDVDIIAPGVCILSTWRHGNYNTISGTSMATPHVAGAAALYKSSHPAASPAQVKGALVSSGTTDWDNSDDGDSTKEPLLNVSGF